ncbi:MAG TPA: hypothetical protein VFW11_18990 [Cyclobacteriaceae bacterium]|nr:hypothetical protein [Cyclobacteriaceae bacterium]
MKMKFTGIMLSICVMLLAVTSSFSQGKRNGRGRGDHGDRHDKEWSDNARVREYYYGGDHYTRSDDRYYHYNTNSWIRQHHPNINTRYVYFRDYNVYYDYKRHVYMTLSGRNWLLTSDIPLVMRSVEPHRIVYVNADYAGDDLFNYHARHSNYNIRDMYCLH